MKTINTLPENDTTNGWSRILPVREPKPALDRNIEADWVVIGAGFAGLAAARQLATHLPEQRILVLEARQVGEGAQGRNSGFAIDIPHNVNSSMNALGFARGHTRLSRAAITHLKELVDHHKINCDWQQSGKFHAAVSDRGIDTVLRPTRTVLDALDEPYTWLEGRTLHDTLGFKHFKAALYTPGTVLVNPAALCRGLADTLPHNVLLHENTPVTKAEFSPAIKLQTPKGSIRAKNILLAVNAFIGQFGFLGHAVMPFAAHASLTRRLTPHEQQALSGLSSWGLTPANSFVGTTLRRTPDQRILIRQHMSYAPGLRSNAHTRSHVRELHQSLFDQRFPMLKGVTMDYTWTGFIAVSANGAPGFGRLAPNVYTAVCQNGMGVTRGTIGGLLAADLACGIENPLIADFEALGQATRLPPRPLLDIGARLRLAWEVRRERAEA